MNYILATLSDQGMAYRPDVVGSYQFVKANASTKKDTHIVSYAHYCGHMAKTPLMAFNDIEKVHYQVGQSSIHRMPGYELSA